MSVLKAFEWKSGFSLVICQNIENYSTDILVNLKAMRKILTKIFYCWKNPDLPNLVKSRLNM